MPEAEIKVNLAAVLKSFFQENQHFFLILLKSAEQKVSKIWIESQLKNEYSI